MGKRIFMLVCSLLLCVTVSFAWIITKNEIDAKSFMIHYDHGTLIISDKNIKASLWMRSNEDESTMVEVSNSQEDSDPSNLYVVENVVPGAYVYFTIRLQNTTQKDIIIDLSINRLRCDASLIDDPISPKIYVHTSGVTYHNYPIAKDPGERNQTLLKDQMTELDTDVYTLALYSGLSVPPTGNDYVEIEGYFLFSEEMDNTFQGKVFRVESFKVVE